MATVAIPSAPAVRPMSIAAVRVDAAYCAVLGVAAGLLALVGGEPLGIPALALGIVAVALLDGALLLAWLAARHPHVGLRAALAANLAWCAAAVPLLVVVSFSAAGTATFLAVTAGVAGLIAVQARALRR